MEWAQKKEQRPAPDQLFLPKLGRSVVSHPDDPSEPDDSDDLDDEDDGFIGLDW